VRNKVAKLGVLQNLDIVPTDYNFNSSHPKFRILAHKYYRHCFVTWPDRIGS